MSEPVPPPLPHPGGRSPYVPALVAWLVPGAGHAMIGRCAPAAFVAAAIWPLLLGGMALAGFENVNWDRHPYLFALQALAGLPAAAASLLTRDLVVTEHWRHHTVGDLYTCAAGLLNLVAVADVWARCEAGDPEQRAAAHVPEVREFVEPGPAQGDPRE